LVIFPPKLIQMYPIKNKYEWKNLFQDMKYYAEKC